MSKRDAKVYLAAAEKIAARESFFCCSTLFRLCETHEQYSDLILKFASVFKPKYKHFTGRWFGPSWDPEHIEHRILALCLAAAMAEAGDL